jgi:hypothetical protein
VGVLAGSGQEAAVMIELVRRLLSALWGMLAGAIFKRLWKLAARKDEAPKATDADREWREIPIAATAHGATFGLVFLLITLAASWLQLFPARGGVEDFRDLDRALTARRPRSRQQFHADVRHRVHRRWHRSHPDPCRWSYGRYSDVQEITASGELPVFVAAS